MSASLADRVKDGERTGLQLVVQLKIVDECQDQNRYVFDRILVTDPQRGKVRAKRLAKSCGLKLDGDGTYDSDELVGKICVLEIVQKTVLDQTTGQAAIYANVKDYLLPGDPGFPA
jgi:hypothetical protein